MKGSSFTIGRDGEENSARAPEKVLLANYREYRRRAIHYNIYHL